MEFVITAFSSKRPSKLFPQFLIIYRYYWDRRQPVDPESHERFMAETVEGYFEKDFQVMASKNNFARPRAEREYFDKPVNFERQGFRFSPVHKKPIELSGDLRTTSSNYNATPHTPSRMKRNLGVSQTTMNMS